MADLGVDLVGVLAPGQGSQKPGMLVPWLSGPAAERTDAAGTLARWSERTGLDLAVLGTTGTAEEIVDTAITQPLIVATSLLAYAQLRDAVRESAGEGTADLATHLDSPVAGHSVGELAAAAVAGALSPDDAVELAAVRGREMAAACALEDTGMSAVLGGDPDEVLAALERLGLEPANRNGAGQVVAAGPVAALAVLSESPPPGARVKGLPVAGAFHTRFMAPAEQALREWARRVEFADPDRPLLSNADGDVVTTGEQLRERLVAQVTLPVRWDLCMDALGGLGTAATVELPPAGTLSGLVKRALSGVSAVAMKGPDSLPGIAERLAGVGSGVRS